MRTYIREQGDRIMQTALQKSAKDASEYSIDVQTHIMNEAYWDAIMARVITSEDDAKLIDLAKPHLTSMISQAYTRIGSLMGVAGQSTTMQQIVPRISQQIAQNLTNVNTITRERIRSTVSQSLLDGDTPRVLAGKIEATIESMSKYRSATIARTELTNAFNRGSILAFKQCETLTHISVIGCEARNDSDNYYHGEHTCNIQDVPIEDAETLTFHPNHTGCMVPSRFRE